MYPHINKYHAKAHPGWEKSLKFPSRLVSHIVRLFEPNHQLRFFLDPTPQLREDFPDDVRNLAPPGAA